MMNNFNAIFYGLVDFDAAYRSAAFLRNASNGRPWPKHMNARQQWKRRRRSALHNGRRK